MNFLKVKKNCLNCHFFTKENNRHPHSLRKIDRENIIESKEFIKHYNYCCKKGMWDRGVHSIPDTKLLILINKKRKYDECFFHKYSEGMLFDAASELIKLNRENKNQKLTRKISYLGIVISAISLYITFKN